jgi:hypothetical protein
MKGLTLVAAGFLGGSRGIPVSEERDGPLDQGEGDGNRLLRDKTEAGRRSLVDEPRLTLVGEGKPLPYRGF